MDGVLIDTEKHFLTCWQQAAAESGFPMTREQALLLRSLAAKYARPMLQEIFGSAFDYDAVRMRRKELMKDILKEQGIEKKKGVDELLLFLKNRGIKTAVATATDLSRTTEYLKQIGIYESFDAIICATMVENGKPAPDIYRYACEQIGEKPQECVAVEDSPNGVNAALAAQVNTIMVPDLTPPEETLVPRLLGVADSLLDIIGMFPFVLTQE